MIEELGLSSLIREDLASLSGGERKRASLARGIIEGADLLVLDEVRMGLSWRSS